MTPKGGFLIAGRVEIEDSATIEGRGQVLVNYRGAIDEPLEVHPGGWFLARRVLAKDDATPDARVAVRALGYEPQDLPITPRFGEVTYVRVRLVKSRTDELATAAGSPR